MSGDAAVVIGMPVYNGEAHIQEALESLLSQTHRRFELLVVDDGSSDRSWDLIGRYVDDPRVRVARNETRLGLVANWQRTFRWAEELRPGLEYFAWASDHDVWHPRWLASLLDRLESRPDAVAAFPQVGRIHERGTGLRRDNPPAETVGVDDPWERAEMAWEAGAFGSRVYGLFRARALVRCGVFRTVYVPDRLLLVEMAIQGPFCEVDDVLWLKRVTATPSLERQRASFFPGGRPPLGLRLPWWAPHVTALYWSLGVRGTGLPQLSRRRGRAFARRYRELAQSLDAGAKERRA